METTTTENVEAGAPAGVFGAEGERPRSRKSRFLSHVDELVAAKNKLDQATGEYRNTLKRAKDDGFLQMEMSRAIKERRQDKDTRDASRREYDQYVRWLEDY